MKRAGRLRRSWNNKTIWTIQNYFNVISTASNEPTEQPRTILLMCCSLKDTAPQTRSVIKPIMMFWSNPEENSPTCLPQLKPDLGWIGSFTHPLNRSIKHYTSHVVFVYGKYKKVRFPTLCGLFCLVSAISIVHIGRCLPSYIWPTDRLLSISSYLHLLK